MFDSLKNLGQLTQVMSKAQKLQEEMKPLQEEMAHRRISADAGDGRVTATVSGRMELLEIRLNPDRLDTANIPMLQDLIVLAVRSAQVKAAQMVQEEMARLASDLGLPPGMLPASV